MSVTPRQAARIAHSVLEPLGRLIPELAPLTTALTEELETRFPELAPDVVVNAGPTDPDPGHR